MGASPPHPPRKPLPKGFLDSLHAAFGERVATGEAVRSQHGQSEAHFEPALPDAVVFARSTEDVVELVKLCTAAGVPIVAYGAGTSIEGNALPVCGGVTVDLGQMDAILAVNAEDFDCTVQAGVRREQLNEHLRDQGLFFPIDPGANATIGGMAATRASGTNAVRYGTMREAVLSLRVVTPDGRDIRTSRRARKSAAGYDLTRLMIGSEGTLGIITEVTLRLMPPAPPAHTLVATFKETAAATAAILAITSAIRPSMLEYMDNASINAVEDVMKMGLDRSAAAIVVAKSDARDAAEVKVLLDACHGNAASEVFDTDDEVEGEMFVTARRAVIPAVERKGRLLLEDVGVPVPRLPELVSGVERIGI
jgi:D-lactate dehydrogenase (cytochrome)